MPPPPGRRRTRSNGAGKFTAAEDLATGMLQRGTRSKGESKPTAAGDVVLLLGEGTGKIVASEDSVAFPF